MGDWVYSAACIGKAALFFKRRDQDADYSEAKKICAGCKVKDECLDFAMKNYEPRGVWGGMTPRERSALRRKRSIARRKAQVLQ